MTNAFAPTKAQGFDFTPRPRIASPTEARAYLNTQRAELIAALDTLAYMAEINLRDGDADETERLLAEAEPLRAKLADIVALEVTR